METKWQAKWNYYGWKEYLDVVPDRPSMQGDWNSTLLTKINQMRNNILMVNQKTEIGVSVNSNLFNTIISGLPFSNIKDGVTYLGRLSVNIDETLTDDKVYVYDKNNEENIAEITIDYVSETRD
jgi:hypothetical protein